MANFDFALHFLVLDETFCISIEHRLRFYRTILKSYIFFNKLHIFNTFRICKWPIDRFSCFNFFFWGSDVVMTGLHSLSARAYGG